MVNLDNPIDAIADDGTPFSPALILRSAPNGARGKNHNLLTCTASAQALLAHANCEFSPLDSISLRTGYYGTATDLVTRGPSAP